MTEYSKVKIKDGLINFVCLREECQTPCCGPFSGLNTDIDSVHGREFFDIFLTDNDHVRLIENGRSDLAIKDKDGHYKMLLNLDGSCTAFVEGRCSVHRFKPSLCRAYPFYIDLFTGLCASRSCPGFGGGWTQLSDIQQEIECTMNMYEHWLKVAESDLHQLSTNND